MFWTYLVAALQTAAPGIGDDALSLLQSPQPPIEAVLATLLNDLDAVPNDVVLVLDDYHVIEARDVQDGMAFLLEHLPPQVHLVIASRADPALPLARLRGRGELVEIRAADLRFTPDEAAAYLNEVMGLALTAQDVAALEGRTEGWIAALQLAALSMQGRDDIAGFIAGFAGDDRYIVDYLVEEVLQRQPEQVRSFLLQTSILSRLSGPLCDAVTGQDGGKAMLEALDRGNLFLVPLDDRRRWYRYHHLFADVLRARLLDEQPDDVPSCTGGRATGTSRTANGPRRSATRWPARTSSERRTWSSWRSRRLRQQPAGGDAASLARGASRRGDPGQARAQQRVRRRRSWCEARSRASRRGCGTPSGGWTRDGLAPDMVVVDEEAFRRLRGRSPSPGRAGPDPRRRGRHHDPCPAGARARRRGRSCRARSGGRPARARVLDERGSRGRAPLVRRGHGQPGEGRARRRRARLRDHPGGHPDRPRPAPARR